MVLNDRLIPPPAYFIHTLFGDRTLATKGKMESNRATRIEELQARIDKVGGTLETTIHEDHLLLLHVERVAAHCKRTLLKMGEEARGDKDTPQDGSSPSSFGSSTTDTTTPDKKSIQSSSMDSLSALEARELFPESPASHDQRASPSSESSSRSLRTHFVRKIAYEKEQQVRAIMSKMQKRMKRQSSA